MDFNEIFATIYQFFYYPQTLSKGLYFNNDYATIGLITLFSSLMVTGIYYFIINHPRFNQLKHWILVMLIVAFFTSTLTWYFVSTTVTILELNNIRSVEIILFSLLNGFVFIAFSFVFSIVMKYFSINCSKTPF